MAGLAAIRDAIKTTIEANVTALHVYDTVPEGPQVLPCVVVIPFTSDFVRAMGRGLDTWEIDLLILTSFGDGDLGQDQLDTFVTGAGAASVRQAIFNNKTLGLSDTDAHISQMLEYGARFASAQFDHIGARLRLVVHTLGTV